MDHVQYMQLALEPARRAYAAGNRPVGCVIVRDGAVISEFKFELRMPAMACALELVV